MGVVVRRSIPLISAIPLPDWSILEGTVARRRQYESFSSAVRDGLARAEHNRTIQWCHAGRPGTGFVRFPSNPSDGDVVSISVVRDGETISAIEYECNNAGPVSAGRVEVLIGATPAETAARLATAITRHQRSSVVATASGDAVDCRARNSGDALLLSAAGTNIIVQTHADAQPQRVLYWYVGTRTLTDADIARGVCVVQTGMSHIVYYMFQIRASASSGASVSYNGTVAVSGGNIVFHNNGTLTLASGNTISVVAIGE